MKDFFNDDWTCLEKKLLISTSFLFGLVLGFMFAPIKKGIFCGNYNGSRNYPAPTAKP